MSVKVLNRLLIAAYCVFMMASCSNGRTRFYDASVSDDPTEISIEPFFKDLFLMDSTQLVNKYGEFVPLYAYRVINVRSISDIELFKADTGIIELQSDVDSVYASYSDVEQKLNLAFKYFHHYFPDKEVPRILFHVSGFNQSIVTADGFLSASIDQYLGSDYKPYNAVAYNYEVPFMTREQLPVDMMYGWVTATFPECLTGDRMLDQMIFQGKLIYLIRVFFPDEPEYRVLSYTEEQLRWCDRYEKEIWGYILENKEVFSTDWRVYTKYMSPAPFTSGLSQDSPGRIGVYLGYRIVESYMNHNADVTLPQLMQPTESQKFLQDAVYRP